MTRAEPQSVSTLHVRALARMAYAFVRGHVESVAALAHLVGGRRSSRRGCDE